MKKHNAFKVVLITLVVIALLSWIFPAAYYSGEYVDQGRVQMGLADVYNYLMTSMSYFSHYAVYLIFVGIFYGILYKIPAYRTFLDKIARGVNPTVFVILVTVLLALGVSVAGLQIGFAIFVPFIVSVILLMGFDKIVAAMVVVGSMAAGLVGSTFAYGNNSILLQALSLDNDYLIFARFVILLLAVLVVLFNIFMYMKRSMVLTDYSDKPAKKETPKEEVPEEVKEEVIAPKVESKKSATKPSKNTKSSSKTSKNTKSTSSKGKGTKKNVNKAAVREEDIIVVKESVSTGEEHDEYLVPTRVEVTHSTWPLAVGFVLLFVLLVLAWITWGENGFGVTFFDEITDSFKDYELFGFPIFAKIYGTVYSFGNWSVIDLLFPIALLLTIWTIIYRVKFSDIIDGMIAGAKKAFVPATVLILLYTILVAATYHPFQMSIYHAVLSIFKGFNIATASIVTLLSGIINVDPAYAYQALLPYYTGVVGNAENYPLVGVIAQSMYGFATIFAPTSVILMCSLAYLKVNYKDWLKNIWKLLLELFVLLLIVFIILALV